MSSPLYRKGPAIPIPPPDPRLQVVLGESKRKREKRIAMVKANREADERYRAIHPKQNPISATITIVLFASLLGIVVGLFLKGVR